MARAKRCEAAQTAHIAELAQLMQGLPAGEARDTATEEFTQQLGILQQLQHEVAAVGGWVQRCLRCGACR